MEGNLNQTEGWMEITQQRLNAIREAIMMVGFFQGRVKQWREDHEDSRDPATAVLLDGSLRRIRRTLDTLAQMREEAEFELNTGPWEQPPDGWRML